ncbi:MAG: PepSY domain-containing protein [Desulfurivibrionaceae bacterium]|jgi:hypothetical protein|nr:PepSY domain-containing protein [Pseudomonadota bacterium]MCG2824308.1 PepSY domain-containing protein [Desulfobulbaceae bacterium]MDP2003990.1 PepSY domain-containing protein [Desulfurivibrionaceae bacterium]PKN22996.1 MAG: hypothetical protein CVU68_02430 [Deltaproteobacteria bacterium HGW-Deltaproteobacteria-3]MBU4229152.1 PepSY domain-containing protein [Pseudomonadota bacterium]
MMRLMRSLHKYVGLAAALVILLLSVTGILLIHRKELGLNKVLLRVSGPAATAPDVFDLLGEPDGPVLAAAKQGVLLREQGAWRVVLPEPAKRLYKIGTTHYACTKSGLYTSQDGGRNWGSILAKEEVKALLPTSAGLVAATGKGLFRQESQGWKKLAQFSKPGLEVRAIFADGQGLLVAAKEGVFGVDEAGRVSAAPVSLGMAGPATVDLQKVVTDLHTGDFFGSWFFLVVDLAAVALVLLTASGIYLWFRPQWKKRGGHRK